MTVDKNVFALDSIPSNKAKKAGPSASAARVVESEFVSASRTRSVPEAKLDSAEWRSLDPSERVTHGINVRFNDYELALLRAIAKREDRSIQKIIKRLLIPAAQQAADSES